MRAIAILLSAIWVQCSWASQICFHDAMFTCCGPGCEFPEPMPWTGFQTDPTGPLACSDLAIGNFAAVSLSTSDEDPFLNLGDIPSEGRLYLWNVGVGEADPDWGEVELYTIGDIPILAYEPVAIGGKNFWNAVTGYLYFDGCLGPRPDIIGVFIVDPGSVAVSDPTTSVTWGRVKSFYK